MAIGDRAAQHVLEGSVAGRRGEVVLGDLELGRADVAVAVGPAARRAAQRARCRRCVVGLGVAGADHRVDVGRDRHAGGVGALGAGLLAGTVVALVAAGQVVRVGLQQRQRGARRLGRPQRLGLVAGGLQPRPEHRLVRHARLAADERREAPQRIGRPRPGDHAQVQRGAVGFDAPAPCPQRVAVRLVAQGEHAVPAGGQQPRHGEVRGVVARAEARGRHERADQRAVLGRPRPVGHERLDLAASAQDGVGALAEAQEALSAAGGERQPGGGRCATARLQAQRRDPRARRPGGEARAHARGRRRRQLGDEPPAASPQGGHAREPHRPSVREPDQRRPGGAQRRRVAERHAHREGSALGADGGGRGRGGRGGGDHGHGHGRDGRAEPGAGHYRRAYRPRTVRTPRRWRRSRRQRRRRRRAALPGPGSGPRPARRS